MNLISKMLADDHFSPTERVIIQYILENREEIIHLTITQLAKETYTSNPAIIRLCKKLGESGFRSFKARFISDLEKTKHNREFVDVNYPFHMYERADEVANDIALLTKNTIDTCYKELDGITLNRVAQLLNRSTNILMFAIGDSYIQSLSFKNKILKLGKKLVNTSTLNEDLVYANTSHKDDCALFITYSGISSDYELYAHHLKGNGTPIVVITANPRSHLALLADYVISFPDMENQIDSIATFYSQISIEYILNILYSLIYAQHYETNQRNKLNLGKKRHMQMKERQ